MDPGFVLLLVLLALSIGVIAGLIVGALLKKERIVEKPVEVIRNHEVVREIPLSEVEIRQHKRLLEMRAEENRLSQAALLLEGELEELRTAILDARNLREEALSGLEETRQIYRDERLEDFDNFEEALNDARETLLSSIQEAWDTFTEGVRESKENRIGNLEEDSERLE